MISRTLRLSTLFLISPLVLVTQVCSQTKTAPTENPPYKNTSLPVDQRVADLLKRMTLEEKATMLSGSGWMESAPIERLGIPAIKMADGPLGVRSWIGSSALTNSSTNPMKVETTAFPSGIAMAATWDPDLVQREGQAVAQETEALGRDMILGPTVNINRIPLWGRNFEGYGEDPYLAGQLAVAYIRGVQGEGVIIQNGLKWIGPNDKKRNEPRHGFIAVLKVTNTGQRSGDEVVQLYIHDGHSKLDRPVHELKAFKRIELKPGESKLVHFEDDLSPFEYWNPSTKQWTLDPGTFEIQIGASSRDIRLKTPIQITR